MQAYFEGTPGMLITEDDVRRLLLRQQVQNKLNMPSVKKLYRALITLVVLAGVSYGILNAPALFIKTKFAIETQIPPAGDQNQSAPLLPVPGQNNQTPVNISVKAKLPDNHLIINRIHVNVPINWNISGDDATVLPSLQAGVSQIKGSALPNEQGNVFIVGHSSNYLWAKGSYKYVFALLPQLAIGDTITLTYQNQDFTYKVNQIKTVSPDDVAVMQAGNKAQLSLMTCVPLGTKLKRLVVIADPIAHTRDQLPVGSGAKAAHLPGAQ